MKKKELKIQLEISGLIVEQLNKDLADKTRQLQEAWNGKENVQMRKDAAYWKEVFEISSETVKQYKKDLEQRDKLIREQRQTILNLSNLSMERGKELEKLRGYFSAPLEPTTAKGN